MHFRPKTKLAEILFSDSKRRRWHVDEPSPLPGIVHCRSMKMLGVIIGDDFSVAQHVQRLVASSAQTHYALRVLRCHGLNTAALQHIYRATVVARITYAASAWHGFTKASQRQRIDKVMDRVRRLGYYLPDAPTFGDLCDTTDDELFSKARLWSNHVLHALLLPLSAASQRYNFRQRPHSLQLPEHKTQLSNSNFLICLQYKNTY